MKTEFSINVASIDDAAAITTVRRVTWLSTYPNEEFGILPEDIEAAINQRTFEEEVARTAERIHSDSQTTCFVAKDGDKVVGFVTGLKGNEKNRIGAIYVLPAYQGKGIGTKLMEQVDTWLGNDKEVSLEVVTYNTKTLDFYKKLGFVENGPSHNPVAKLPTGKELPQIEMIKR